MNKSSFLFSLTAVLFFLTNLGFMAEANSFLNGAPAVLDHVDQTMTQVFRQRDIPRTSVKVKVGGEFRYRFELRNNYNFNSVMSEDDPVSLFRTRFNIDIVLGPYLRVFAEGQDAEAVANQASITHSTNFVNTIDLHQLYAEVKSPWKKIPLTTIVGRQKLIYGDQRFVGDSNWTNVDRVFDAVKVIWNPKTWFRLDAWFSQPVYVKRTQADYGQHNDNFYGIYNTLGPYKDHLLDTFLFIRNLKNDSLASETPGVVGPLKEYTVGNRFLGKKWNFDYGTEYAVQFGSRAHNDIVAWAFHQEIGYTFPKVFSTPRIAFEFNHASGDSNPRDGKVQTFDNLFPTNHDKYGAIDFLSLKNMDDIRIGTNLKPHQKLLMTFEYHWFFLDTSKSSWFNAAQQVVRAGKPGASSTLGQELDLWAKWNLSQHFDFILGYSKFFSGAFVKDTGPASNADLFYTQVTVKV